MLGVKPLLQSVQRHDLLLQPRSRRWKPNIRCHSELAVGGANYLRPEYHIGFERSGGVVDSGLQGALVTPNFSVTAGVGNESCGPGNPYPYCPPIPIGIPLANGAALF